jgi:hypothetical protein
LVGIGYEWVETLGRVVGVVILVMGTLGLGKTLLACGAAQALYGESSGQPSSLRRILLQQRWGATLGLMGRMIIPSLIRAFFGYLGVLLTLSWWVAPAALIFEGLGSRDAIKHGRALVKPVRGQMVDVLVALWLIGWLIAGAPLLGGFWLLNLLIQMPPQISNGAMMIGWIAGSVFVAPLMALGSIHFYLYVRDRAAQNSEIPAYSIHRDIVAMREATNALRDA